MSRNFPKPQKGSFRGAKFETFDAEVLFGRRNVVHEYPLKDEPFAEDLGKKAREYTFNCYVIGNNYQAARNALMRAIENDDTPGTLIHPTLGSILAVPKDCRVNFSNREGNFEYFTLTFVEAGSQAASAGSFNTGYFSRLFAGNAISSFISFFASTFVTKNLPDFLHSAAVTNLIGNPLNVSSGNNGSFISTIQNIIKTSSSGSANSDYTELNDKLVKFEASVETDLDDPETLATNISDIITSLSNVYINQTVTINNLDTFLYTVRPNHPEMSAIEVLKRLMTYGDGYTAIPETTALRLQQIINEQELISLVKHCALCEMIKITSDMEFPSRQDAIEVRDGVDEYIKPRLIIVADSGYDVPYIALNDARSGMIKDINTRAATLKNKKYITTNDAVPAILFAYDQYEDASLDYDIVRRNRIRNPCFIPPSSVVEIVI